MKQPLMTSLSFRKIPILPILCLFCKPGIYGKAVCQSLIVFSLGHMREILHFVSSDCFQLKFFHISPVWSRSFTENVTDQLCPSGVFVTLCQQYNSLWVDCMELRRVALRGLFPWS